MERDKSDNSLYAKESDKTKRARDRLRKQLEDVEKRITPDALRKKTQEIQKWIAKHAHQRVVLEKKNITLFDEKENTAPASKAISRIFAKVQKNLEQTTLPASKLNVEKSAELSGEE